MLQTMHHGPAQHFCPQLFTSFINLEIVEAVLLPGDQNGVDLVRLHPARDIAPLQPLTLETLAGIIGVVAVDGAGT